MLLNMAAKWNNNVNDLVQTIIQYPAFRETINSILIATKKIQSTDIILIAHLPIKAGWQNAPHAL